MQIYTSYPLRLIRTTKKICYSQKFYNLKGNNSGTWKLINNILNKNKSVLPEEIDFKGENWLYFL